MVICFEEKDRYRIKALGMSVIEYKRMLYRLTGAYDNIRQRVFQVVNAVFDAAQRAIECLKTTFRNIQLTEPRRRWKITKQLTKININYAVFFPQHGAYHCRNNC